MELVHLVALALVQGLTEFLPISSSAHLILLPQVMGWSDQGLSYDIAAHLGTLTAVCGYFRQDLLAIMHAGAAGVKQRSWNAEARLGMYVLLATLPACVCGVLFKDFIEAHLRSSLVIAITTIGFGLVLGWADIAGKRSREIAGLTVRNVLLIGCAQALALIPGTSRSGITMTAALALGYSRQASARFSFLLSVPLILLASLLEAVDLATGDISVDWIGLAVVTVLSALSAYLCIFLFLRLLDRVGMLPFVAYRLALGAVLLLLIT